MECAQTSVYKGNVYYKYTSGDYLSEFTFLSAVERESRDSLATLLGQLQDMASEPEQVFTGIT